MKTRAGSRSGPKLSPCPSGARAVFLAGFMGAGKTSVGKALGRRLGWLFEDLDDRIQAREGRSIEQIFRESGEAAFRKAEEAGLRALLSELRDSPRVVALGGGAFVQPEIAMLLEQSGLLTVFLDAGVDELFRRCQQQQLERPLRRDLEQFRQLYEARRPHYLKARVRIDTSGKDIEAVAAEVVEALGFQER